MYTQMEPGKARKPGKMTKRIGRPPKPEGERKSASLIFRARPQLRERLGAAAAASGRSISEEIEYILNRHFEFENLEKHLGPKLAMRARYGELLDDWAKEIIRDTVNQMLDAQAERKAAAAEIKRKTTLLDQESDKEEGSK
jgi:hypothetical protein